MATNFDPKMHPYVEHRTYTGPGCAQCGKPKSEHNEVVVKTGEGRVTQSLDS